MIQDMKKARSNAATLERTAEPEANNHENPESTLKHTTSNPPGQVVHITDFLSSGEEHAIPMQHLRKLIHLPARTIRLMIRAERLSGTPILENSKSGYYLPADASERAQCVRRLLHRAKPHSDAPAKLEEIATRWSDSGKVELKQLPDVSGRI